MSAITVRCMSSGQVFSLTPGQVRVLFTKPGLQDVLVARVAREALGLAKDIAECIEDYVTSNLDQLAAQLQRSTKSLLDAVNSLVQALRRLTAASVIGEPDGLIA